MAINSGGGSRDIRLGLGVETSGEEDVRSLADSVRDLGRSGDPAAAGFVRLADEIDRAIIAAVAARRAEADADTARREARKTLDEQRDALARLRAESDRSKRGTEEYAAAERAQRLQIIESRVALRDKQAALAAASAAARAAAAAEGQLTSEANAAAAAFRRQGDAGKAAAGGLESIGAQLRTIQSLAGAALGGSLLTGLIGDVGRTADAFNNLQARVKLASGEGAAFTTAMQGVQDIAQRTGTSLQITADLYAKVATNTKALGLTTVETLRVVESVSQAVQLSGASAESSAAAVTQFAQALASGVLRGDELNSVLEQSPRLAQALAAGLGVTTGELRKLGEAGSLSSRAVIDALQGQSAALQAEFNQLPPTIGRAVMALANSWTVYVGEVDRATGASATAASVIETLANNLSTVGALLYSAGKAAAALVAVNLARSLLSTATAATTATAAVSGLAAATAAANAEAAAGAGKFAGLVSSLKLFGLLTVVTNLREIGTAIGEGTAKLFGYGKAIEELERTQAADAEAARRWAASTAALNQQLQFAAEKSLGLTDQSRALVAEFDSVIAKGGSVTEALAKIGKGLELDNLSGIAAAGAALDALALKGKVSGQQVSDALASALKGEDLARFRIQAGAAFDETEQGARRLKAALDAIATESLRRAGTSLDELRTGFSAAATSAINDVDALSGSLDALGIKGADAGRALSTSLDKALAAAGTARAVQAVEDRFAALGKAGLLSGDQVAAGMEKARAKVDSLLPGVNSLDEALRAFGLKTATELQLMAERFKASFEIISRSTTVSLTDKARAFEQYAAAATAANRGVETSEIRVQREMLRAQGAAVNAGRAIGDAMDAAGGRVDALATKLSRVSTAAGKIDSGFNDRVTQSGNESEANSRAINRTSADNTGLASLRAKNATGTLGPDDQKTAQAVLEAARIALQIAQQYGGAVSNAGARDALANYNEARNLVERTSGGGNGPLGGVPGDEIYAKLLEASQAAKPAPAPAPAQKPPVYNTVNVTIGGKTYGIGAASKVDADKMIAALEEAYRSSGGG